MRLLILILLLPFTLFGQRGGGGSMMMGGAQYNSYMAPSYGALVNGAHLNPERAHIAKELGCKSVRMAIKEVSWDGNSELFNVYRDSGLKIVLDVDMTEQSTPRPFETNMVAWAAFLNDVLDQHTPDLLVIGNEPLNGPGSLPNGSQTDPPTGYYIGPLSNYVIMLQTAYPIAKARGIPMTCGGIGLNGAGLFGLTYRWLKTKYNQATANAFGANCMNAAQINCANSPDPTVGCNGFNYECKQQDTILAASAYLDMINIHSYEIIDPDVINDTDIVTNTTLVWRGLKEYVEDRTKKPCISNEIGQRGNIQPALVAAMLTEAHRLGFKYFIWYSGTGPANPPAYPLHNMQWDGTGDPLRSNGVQFKASVLTKQ